MWANCQKSDQHSAKQTIRTPMPVRIKIWEATVHQWMKGFGESQVTFQLSAHVSDYSVFAFTASHSNGKYYWCLLDVSRRDPHSGARNACGTNVHSRCYGAWPRDGNCCNQCWYLLLLLTMVVGTKKTKNNLLREQKKKHLAFGTNWLYL